MNSRDRKAELIRSGKTLTALAASLGVSISMVSRVVSGEKRSLRIERRIAQIIGRPHAEVFGQSPQSTKVA